MFKGWKTILWNTFVAVVPLLEVLGAILNIPEIRGIIPVSYYPIYLIVSTLVNYILRYYTNTSIGKKV